ncbi:unnamed protein product, partial [Ectocarpus sp. 13 AM-2016]
ITGRSRWQWRTHAEERGRRWRHKPQQVPQKHRDTPTHTHSFGRVYQHDLAACLHFSTTPRRCSHQGVGTPYRWLPFLQETKRPPEEIITKHHCQHGVEVKN